MHALLSAALRRAATRLRVTISAYQVSLALPSPTWGIFLRLVGLRPIESKLAPCAACDWPSAGKAVSPGPALSIKPTLGTALTNACAPLPPACEQARNGCLISFEWLFLSAQTICHYHVVKRAPHKTKAGKKKPVGAKYQFDPPHHHSNPSSVKTFTAKQSFYLPQTLVRFTHLSLPSLSSKMLFI